MKSLEASGGASGGGFDRKVWKALLGPSLESWDRLSANPAALEVGSQSPMVREVTLLMIDDAHKYLVLQNVFYGFIVS